MILLSNMKNGNAKKKERERELGVKEIMQGKDTKTSKDFNILLEIREDMVSGNVNRML